MNILITNVRPYTKNTLKSFVSVLLSDVGLEIRDCTYHEGPGKRWINLPAKPYTTTDGKLAYSYIIDFPDKINHLKFQQQALAALDEYLTRNST